MPYRSNRFGKRRRDAFPTQYEPKDVDFLLEVPNLGLADGYGQSARSMVKLMRSVCVEENIPMRILDKRNICGPILREQEFKEISPLLIDEAAVRHVKFYLRYALPLDRKVGIQADNCGTFTMFETDRVPESWVGPLNSQDVVITPTEWGREVFSSWIEPPVLDIPLPVNPNYYSKYERETLLRMPKDKFVCIIVGHYFDPDRKRIIELIEKFYKAFETKNAELIVKSSWLNRESRDVANIEKVCERNRRKVTLDSRNISTEELIDLYCTAHLGLFPSRGEGFGLPQMELALLGRPLIVAMNTALTSTSKFMPEVIGLPCKLITSDYRPQLIKGDTGHWFECDMDDFIQRVLGQYEQWAASPENFGAKILEYHNKKEPHSYCSHGIIKEKYRALIRKWAK